jgi:hypothetical protein
MFMSAAQINPWSMDLHQRNRIDVDEDPKMVRVFADRLRLKIATAMSSEKGSDNHWEWYVILTLWPPLDVIRLLEDPSERAARLRRTSPFVSLLSEDEKGACLSGRFCSGALDDSVTIPFGTTIQAVIH